ncbi:MAG: rod shape-determining protein MreD [Fidelibacterota bacterium]
MKRRTQISIGILVLLLQLFLSEYLTVQRIRPDFLLIFVIYIAVREGSLTGVIYGFVLGLMEDFLSAGSLLGLAPLTKSLTGFLMGRLQGKFAKMNPLVFHSLWIALVLFHFVFYVYIRLQDLYETSQPLFWKTWTFTVLYTLVFMAIFQVIVPLPPRSASSVEDRS